MFTYFAQLPIEIRLQIWKAAAHVTRNLDLQVRGDTTTFARRDKHGRRPRRPSTQPIYTSVCRPTAILHTNQEARSEGLKWYTLDFGSPVSPPQVFINWNVDRVCLMVGPSASPVSCTLEWFKSLHDHFEKIRASTPKRFPDVTVLPRSSSLIAYLTSINPSYLAHFLSYFLHPPFPTFKRHKTPHIRHSSEPSHLPQTSRSHSAPTFAISIDIQHDFYT